MVSQSPYASGTPQRGKNFVKICDRAEWRPVSTPSANGELAETASSSGSSCRMPSWTRDRPVGARDPDVDVQAEGVVPPDDVLEQVVVHAVVRRVDDPLLLPVRPRVRAGRAERQPHRLDEGAQLGASLDERRRHVGEALAAPRLHLHLGRDQLTDEIRLERRPGGGRLDVLEAVDEIEGLGIDECELLLDGDGEVLAGVEPVARVAQELVVGRFAHGSVKASATRRRGDGVTRPPSSTARRRVARAADRIATRSAGGQREQLAQRRRQRRRRRPPVPPRGGAGARGTRPRDRPRSLRDPE